MLLALLLALVFSCSEHPMSTVKDGGGGLEGKGAIDPGATTGFLLGSVSDSTIVGPGRIDVWASNIVFDDSTGIVSLDVQLWNRALRNILPPIHFVISDIIPADISVVGFDGVSGDGFPYYDFSSKLGDDNILEPEERTEPVRMQFHTVTLRSFGIGFRIELGPPGGTGVIGGIVFHDENQDGRRDRLCRCEYGIPGITVALEVSSDEGNFMAIAQTDSAGEYKFRGLKAGVYKVFVAVNPDEWKITSTSPLLVTLVPGTGGEVQDFLRAHFGLYPLRPPQPPNPGILFGPLRVGPMSRVGTELDSTFVNPPSNLPVVFYYYLDVMEPPFEMPRIGVVDSAAAWINGEKVYEYYRTEPPDTVYFPPQTIKLREGLVAEGENSIRITTYGNGSAALVWAVSKTPTMRR